MKTFLEYVNEATKIVTVEVNFADDQKILAKKARALGLNVTFGKNRYADTATLTGEKNKILSLLKSYGYFPNELTYKG